MTMAGGSNATKYITWRDDAGMTHVRDDAPADAVCVNLGSRCPLNSIDGDRFHVGTVLAIESSTFVCCTCTTLGVYSTTEHPLPARIITLTEDRLDYRVVDVCDQLVSKNSKT
jgi:hypothetical protein